MTEQDLIDLGFKRVDVTKEESGCESDYYYYTYYFLSGFGLLTQANDEVINGNWVVEWFAADGKIQFTNIRELAKLITLIENAKIWKKK